MIIVLKGELDMKKTQQNCNASCMNTETLPIYCVNKLSNCWSPISIALKAIAFYFYLP